MVDTEQRHLLHLSEPRAGDVLASVITRRVDRPAEELSASSAFFK